MLMNRMTKSLSWIVLCMVFGLLPSGELVAQKFQNIGLREGLPELICHHACEDEEGFLWIATANGLARFDGSEFKVWNKNPATKKGLPADEIRNLASDNNGRIYFSVGAAKLHYLDKAKEEFVSVVDPVNHFPDSAQIPDLVLAIHATSPDSIWLSAGDLWLYRPSLETVVKFQCDIPRGEIIKTISPDPRDPNRLWLGTYGEAYHLNMLTGKSRVFEVKKGENGCLNAGLSLQDFYDDGEHVWAASWGHSVVRLDLSAGDCHCHYFEHTPPYDGGKNIALSLDAKDDDNLWVTTDRGIATFDKNKLKFTRLHFDSQDIYSPPKHHVHDMVKTQDGAIYFISNSGLYKVDPAINRFNETRVEPGLIDNEVPYFESPIWVDGKFMLIANNGGFVEYHPETGLQELVRFKHTDTGALLDFYPRNTEKLDDTRILTIAEDKAWLLDVKEMTAKPLVEEFSLGGYRLTSFVDSQQRWWVSGQGYGLAMIDWQNDTVLFFKKGAENEGLFDQGWNQGITEDPEGNIWVTGHFGVNRINLKDGTIKHHPIGEVPWVPESMPTDIGIDAEGTMWLATREDGLIVRKYDAPDTVFAHHTVNTFLPSNQFSSLFTAPDGRVMACGYPGMVILNPRAEGGYDVRSFDALDGLEDVILNHAGLMFHDNGMASVNDGETIAFFNWSSAFKSPPSPPRPYVASCTIMGAPTSPDSLQHLSHKRNFAQLQINNLAHRSPNDVETRYKLGDGEEWRELSVSGLITFDNLEPDNYELVIESRYPGADWSAPLLLVINVEPAFFQTLWFKIAIIAVIALVLVLVFRYRAQRIRKEEAMKSEFNQRISEVEMAALRAQMNPHFLFNCLNSINRYILKNDRQKASDYLTKFSRLMRLILQNSKRSMVPLAQELEALRLYIEMEAVRFDDKFKFEFTSDPNLELEFIEVPPLILQPYVENAIWHGLMHKDEQGVLKVAVTGVNGEVTCTIEDNGIGRDKARDLKSKSAQNHKSMGMRITSERMNLSDKIHKTDTSVIITDLVDAQGLAAGTRVEIKLNKK